MCDDADMVAIQNAMHGDGKLVAAKSRSRITTPGTLIQPLSGYVL